MHVRPVSLRLPMGLSWAHWFGHRLIVGRYFTPSSWSRGGSSYPNKNAFEISFSENVSSIKWSEGVGTKIDLGFWFIPRTARPRWQAVDAAKRGYFGVLDVTPAYMVIKSFANRVLNACIPMNKWSKPFWWVLWSKWRLHNFSKSNFFLQLVMQNWNQSTSNPDKKLICL